MVKKILYINLLVLLTVLYSQDIKVTAKIDSANYKIGDYINYKLTINYNKAIKILPFSVKDSLKELDFISQKPVEKNTDGETVTEKYNLVFSKYDSLNTVLKPFIIRYIYNNDTLKASSEGIPIIVEKIKIDNPQAGIKDIKQPLEIPFDVLLLFIILVILFILSLSGYFLYKKYKAKKAETGSEKEILLSPYEEAFIALNNLNEKKLWQKGEIKEYHSELTYIIRKYFEKSFGILALEMPSSELLAELKKQVNDSIKIDIVYSFLSNADMVKFAKFIPMNNINEEMMKQAFNIIDTVKAEAAGFKPEENQNV